ncbi:MAG: hypothetical protein MPJ24_10290, partial [Pirellulaceae bacterium]|nr:hypothetical protein [Pirellulaceae bacterium]
LLSYKTENQQSAISIGRLVSLKNFELVIEVAVEVCRKIREATFSIYGEGKEREALEKIKALKIEKRLSSRRPP